MEFGGDMINFKVSESIQNRNDVRSCFAIGIIKNIGQERSTPIKKDASRTTIEEGIGRKHKEHATALKTPNLAVPKDKIGEMVAALGALPQHPSKSPIPIPIPISTNRLLPSLVQVPNRFQGGGSIYMDFRNQNTTIREDHYPLPFIEPYDESVEGQVVEDIPLHAVGSKRG